MSDAGFRDPQIYQTESGGVLIRAREVDISIEQPRKRLATIEVKTASGAVVATIKSKSRLKLWLEDAAAE